MVMKKISLLLGLVFISIAVFSQHKVTFKLKELTAIKHDSLYITGTFTDWDSTYNKKYLLTRKAPGEFSITLMIPAGDHRYKFTRGSWLSVEKDFYGDEVLDRTIYLSKDTTFTDSVLAWRDELIKDKWRIVSTTPDEMKKSTSLYALAKIYSYAEWQNVDSSFYYISKTLLLLQELKSSAQPDPKLQKKRAEYYIYAQGLAADLLHLFGNFPKELELNLDNLRLATEMNEGHLMLGAYNGVAAAYASMHDFQKMLMYSKKMYTYLKESKLYATHPYDAYQSLEKISLAYYGLNELDSALHYARELYNLPTIYSNSGGFAKAVGGQIIGDINSKRGKNIIAMQDYRSALDFAYANRAYESAIRSNLGLSRLFQKLGQNDSALFYGLRGWNDIHTYKTHLQAGRVNDNSLLAEFGPFVAELYMLNRQPENAYQYLKFSTSLKDSLYNLDKVRQFQNFEFDESLRAQQKEQEIQATKQKIKTKVRTWSLIAGLGVLSILAIILYYNNRQKQGARNRIEKAYSELKATQSQLIQSEKMASLGELTAGIAHEIQNPLNFVNNFSEVNEELLEEMKEELNKGNTAAAKSLATDAIENQKKIKTHGKRADAIVKGMLQHSKTSTGLKEPVNINALADEYLRLAYHGLRAKDKSFNATMKTDFDPTIGNINLIPQDIGRVILNLLTNAFYAVNAKNKTLAFDQHYTPTVSISTKKANGKVEIKVADNGNGIPQSLKDKIFQPFFTTKPAGQGTGLGLSLSYDIIKAHSGELLVDTRENEFTEFTIVLPNV